jgi:fructose-1,6-bisphosphatase/inositol monophosphatase family enzyme
VTIADREAEAALTSQLPELVPGSRVVGEEAVSSDPSLLRLLRDAAPVWLVDPIDGTRNFAAGHGPFGTMVALVERGVPLMAAIYCSEDDTMVLAERGQGVFLNNERLVAASRSYDSHEGTILTKFMPTELAATLLHRARGHQLLPNAMCAAHEYVEVARGRKDYVVYFRLLPWDHVPGALIVREAGGVVRHPDGRDYEVNDEQGPLLLAPSPSSWNSAHHELFA